MKKLFLCLAIMPALALMAGCGIKDTYNTNDYVIVNRIESDIVVELRTGGREIITIAPGETRLIYTEQERHWRQGEPVPIMAPEMIPAEMRIDGEVISSYIWWGEHWDRDDVGEDHDTYTLTVTDELLATVKMSTPTDDFYYGAGGEKIGLTKVANKSFILFDGDDTRIVSQKLANMHITLRDAPYAMQLDGLPNCRQAEVPVGMERLEGIAELIYIAPYYKTDESDRDYPLTNVFNVELHTPGDVDKLEELAAQHKVNIDRKIALAYDTYVLYCTRESSGNALVMANLFYETGLFLSSAPELFTVEPER